MKFFTGQPQDTIGLLSVKLQKLILFLFFANTFEFFRAGAINWLLAAATSVALTFGFVGAYRRRTGMLTCFHVFNLMYFALVLTALVLGLLSLCSGSRPHHAPRPHREDPQDKQEESWVKADGVAWAELDPLMVDTDSSWFEEGLGMGEESSSSIFAVDDWISGGSWFVSSSDESIFDSLFVSGSDWESAFDGWFTVGTGKGDRDRFLSKFGGVRRLRNDKRIGPTRINWGDEKHMMLADEFDQVDIIAKRSHKEHEQARPEKPKAEATHHKSKPARKPSPAATVFVRVMIAAVVALEITAFLVKIYATLLSVRIVTMLRMQNADPSKRRSAFTLRPAETTTPVATPAVAMSPMDIPMEPIPAYQPADGMWVPVQTPTGEVQFAYYPMEVVIAQQQQMMMMAMAYNNYNTQQV